MFIPVMAEANSIARTAIKRKRARASTHGACMLLFAASGLYGQSVSAYRDPVELVRKAVQNEIKASNDDSAHFMFQGTKTTPKGSLRKSMLRPRMPRPAWSSLTTGNL